MAQTTENMVKVECPRCSAKGIIRGYSHVMGGVCFKCGGDRFVYVSKSSMKRAEANAAANAKREDERMSAAASRSAARAARYENDPRIGTAARARGNQYPAVLAEMYVNFELIDAGKINPINADRLLSNYAN